MDYDYDRYNREERYACSHLFRLLHEPKDGYRALSRFLDMDVSSGSFRIYAEVALIRDAYYARKKADEEAGISTRGIGARDAFMDALTRELMNLKEVSDCRLYSKLPDELWDGRKTHPKRMLLNGDALLSPAEKSVYGLMQSMFNAKPDLAICAGGRLFVYEAKLTQKIDNKQLDLTDEIWRVWQKVLYPDLGLDPAKSCDSERKVIKLGLSASKPDISWEKVAEIARETYPPDDRSRIALENVAKLSAD